jgi:hypothetical protein
MMMMSYDQSGPGHDGDDRAAPPFPPRAILVHVERPATGTGTSPHSRP